MTDSNNLLAPKPTKLKPGPGRILISVPFLSDFFFSRSVILLAEHNSEGSFGLIINKPVDFKLNELTTDFPVFNAKVFLGGPVKTDNIFYIHTNGKIPGSMKIVDGVYWGGDIETITDLIDQKLMQPEDIRFFVGYSGWGARQLERELTEDSWVICDSAKDLIMNNDPLDLWNSLVKNLGKDYELWTKFPLDPSAN